MRTRVLVACLLPLLLVPAGACTKSDDGTKVASLGGSATPSATASGSPLEQEIRWARCMRQHGVPMPDPVAEGNSVQQGTVDKDGLKPEVLSRADEACKQYRPVMPAADQAIKKELALQESRCMREHGVENFPDPDSDGFHHLSESVLRDPQYDQAEATCEAQIRSSQPSPSS